MLKKLLKPLRRSKSDGSYPVLDQLITQRVEVNRRLGTRPPLMFMSDTHQIVQLLERGVVLYSPKRQAKSVLSWFELSIFKQHELAKKLKEIV